MEMGPASRRRQADGSLARSLWAGGPLRPAWAVKATRFFLEPRGPDCLVLWVSSHHEHPQSSLAHPLVLSCTGKGVVIGLGWEVLSSL